MTRSAWPSTWRERREFIGGVALLLVLAAEGWFVMALAAVW